ncbi:MAG: NEW3 domain-containing protein [Candidatus Aenigmatarchaeota archaeon]
MKKFLYLFIISIVAILIFNFISNFFSLRITGFVGANFSVNISEVLKGELLISYKEELNWGEFQNITVDFLNTGSVPFQEKIEVRIYYNYGGKLQPLAYYYDSIVTLKPGERRSYRVNYLPPTIGTYYIKVRVPYDGKTVETWKAFIVIYIPPPPPVQIITLPPEVPAPPVEVVETGKPGMEIDYPEKITIAQGESKLFSVIVKNTGQVSLRNMRLAISLPSSFSIEVNPKEIFKVIPNETAVFLVYLTIPNQTLPGIYPLDFEVITDKIKEGRRISVEVVSGLPDIEKEVKETIQYYEYLISEIQNQIDAAFLKGIDVSKAQESLDKAKIALEEAKTYYNLGKYLDAKKKLDEVKDHLQETVFQLSLALIPVYYPAFPFLPLILLLIIILAIILALILSRRRKKKEELKRPKLLRGIET